MSEQFTLGDLITALEAVPDKDIEIRFDFCGMVPTTFDSWRGVYSQLALGYQDYGRFGHDKEVKVETLLAVAREADGQIFTGWKGGDYRMDWDTPLWVSNPGSGHHTIIVGVKDLPYYVVLETAYQPDIWGY